MRSPHDLARRAHLLFTMLTPLDYRYPPDREPPLLTALRAWLHGWPGIGRIVAGMSRQGHDLRLAPRSPRGRACAPGDSLMGGPP